MECLVSVIIPVYNAENTVEKALQSVKDQTFTNLEIIIVNDGSTDAGETKIQKFSRENPQLDIHYISQKNMGVSAARNAGIKIARGNIIALLDADDQWFPEKTARQLEIFKENPETGLLGTRRNNLKILWPYKVSKNNLAEVSFNKLLIRNDLQPSTILFSRKISDSGILFNENQTHAEDVDFFLRATEHFKLFILNENLVAAGGGKRTFGVSGLSADLKKMQCGFRTNLLQMYRQRRIGIFTLYFLRLFYKMKYILLVLRTEFSP